MFNTIKSKIITITLGVFFVLLFVFSMFTYLYYRDTKALMLDFASKQIGVSVQNIDKEIIKLEKNAQNLALVGELYYKYNRKDLSNSNIIKVFERYPETLGGGIWFAPYAFNSAKRLSCIYAYRNKFGKLVIDKQFETANYNYLNQNWYSEVMSDITKTNDVGWSFPYFEKEGSDTVMITAGSGIYTDDGKKLIGLSTVDWEMNSVIKSVYSIKPTQNSFSLFSNPNKDYIIVSTDKYLSEHCLMGQSLKKIPWYRKDLVNITYFTYHGKKYIPYVKKLDNGMELVVCVPKWELFDKIFKSVLAICLALMVISFSVVYLLYSGLRNNILKPIGKLIKIANKISEGETDVEIKVENPAEFAKLASTYDKMTNDIKEITKERERIDSELAIAKSIQLSSLPDIFPTFPARKEFDIYASMIAAKEVGGDFYDFYFIDEKHFMFLIADVAGKGVPAALCMMTTKTLINNISQTLKYPKSLIYQINKKICENNKNGLFITLFAGIVNLETGELACINCGHNPPLIKQYNGEFRYLNIEPNVVLGVVDDADFEIYTTQLQKGDVIFTYTDGVTEALNDREELFGEERLLKSVNSALDVLDIKDISEKVKQDISDYTGAISQSDDITMLVFRYNGNKDFQSRTFSDIANKANYKKFYTWIHQVCNDWSINDEISTKLDMCAEEIYANVQFYAYNGKEGPIKVNITKHSDGIIAEFIDEGREYNPLNNPDPDITLSAEERVPGGLGIYMVKQMSKNMKYARISGRNILVLEIS